MKPLALLGLSVLLLAGCDLLGGEEDDTDALPGKIVFSASLKDETGKRIDDGNIYAMNADGTNLRRLTDFESEGGAVNPAWSPDGQTIAFANFYMSTTGGPDLCLMDADGSNMRPLKVMTLHGIEQPALIGWDPSWSPDGTHLTFSVCLDCNAGRRNFEIYVAEVAGRLYEEGAVKRLTDHPSLDAGASWSPTGEHIAFASERDHLQRGRADLYLMDADGANLRRLTETESISRFTWGPEGRQLAVWVQDALYRADLDGTLQPIAWTPPPGYEDYDVLFPVDWALPNQMLTVARQKDVYGEASLLLILDLITGETRLIEIDLPIHSLDQVDWHVPPSAR